MRFATLDDIDTLLQLETLFPEYRLGKQAFTFLLTRAHAYVVVYLAEEQIVGDIVITYRLTRLQARLYSLVVAPSHRGQGIAHALLQAGECLVKQQGCTEITLELRQDNESALRLYTGANYRISAQLANYYGDNVMGLQMSKILTIFPVNPLT